MKSYKLTGIVIKRSNLGEADKIITLYTLESGKVSLKAKSIRKISSKKAGSLELFNQVRVAVVKGRGNLDVITEVDLVQSFSSWKNYLGRVNIAYQLSEIIDKLTFESDPNPNLYNLVSSRFSQISGLDINWQKTIDTWFMEILVELGFWPQGKKVSGDIGQIIETITQRPLNSAGILARLK